MVFQNDIVAGASGAGGGYTIGQSIRIGSDYFKVVGIVHSERSAGSLQTPDQEVDAYIPLNVAYARFGDISMRRTSTSIMCSSTISMDREPSERDMMMSP